MTNETRKISDLFSYSNDLYYAATGDKSFKWKNFYELKTFLEGQGWIVQVTSDFYTTGINFNWQILVWDKTAKYHNYISSDYSTGVYGDNGEYKSSYSAMMYGVVRAMELFCLFKTVDISFNNFIGENEKINLLDIVMKHDKGVKFLTIDDEWWKYTRKSAKEYLEYIKNRIKEVIKWENSDVDV